MLDNKPVDQFIGMNHDWLLGFSPENAVTDKNNLYIQVSHSKDSEKKPPKVTPTNPKAEEQSPWQIGQSSITNMAKEPSSEQTLLTSFASLKTLETNRLQPTLCQLFELILEIVGHVPDLDINQTSLHICTSSEKRAEPFLW